MDFLLEEYFQTSGRILPILQLLVRVEGVETNKWGLVRQKRACTKQPQNCPVTRRIIKPHASFTFL